MFISLRPAGLSGGIFAPHNARGLLVFCPPILPGRLFAAHNAGGSFVFVAFFACGRYGYRRIRQNPDAIGGL